MLTASSPDSPSLRRTAGGVTDHVHSRDRGDALGGALVGAWVQTGPLPQGPMFTELDRAGLPLVVCPSHSAATRQDIVTDSADLSQANLGYNLFHQLVLGRFPKWLFRVT